jgi:hypothetical protein
MSLVLLHGILMYVDNPLFILLLYENIQVLVHRKQRSLSLNDFMRIFIISSGFPKTWFDVGSTKSKGNILKTGVSGSCHSKCSPDTIWEFYGPS